MIDSYYKKEDKILIANILDKYKFYLKTGKSNYTNFLNSEKLKIATQYLNYKKIPYSIFEPYPFLEKKIIYFGKYDNFVTIYKIIVSNVNHQQILGTLFSLGLEEDLIGDIFVENGYFYYTNLTKMNSFLENNLVMIKNKPIILTKVDNIILNKEHFENFKILVSSMRIDSIISKLTCKSRNQVNKMILDKIILLNYNEVKNASSLLKTEDILSVRKYGKYKIGKQLGFTKKGNIILEIMKYI